MDDIELKRNPKTNEVEAYKGKKKMDTIVTMGDLVAKRLNRQEKQHDNSNV